MQPRLTRLCVARSFLAFLPCADTARRHLEIWRGFSPDPSHAAFPGFREDRLQWLKPLSFHSATQYTAGAQLSLGKEMLVALRWPGKQSSPMPKQVAQLLVAHKPASTFLPLHEARSNVFNLSTQVPTHLCTPWMLWSPRRPLGRPGL